MAHISAVGRRAGLSSSKKTSFLGLLGLYRQRRALARLDDAALRDVGLTRAEAQAEAKRPIWDVPANWVRC